MALWPVELVLANPLALERPGRIPIWSAFQAWEEATVAALQASRSGPEQAGLACSASAEVSGLVYLEITGKVLNPAMRMPELAEFVYVVSAHPPDWTELSIAIPSNATMEELQNQVVTPLCAVLEASSRRFDMVLRVCLFVWGGHGTWCIRFNVMRTIAKNLSAARYIRLAGRLFEHVAPPRFPVPHPR